MELSTEVAIIGAGPIGLETAALLKRNGVPYIQFERGPLGRTITTWPRHTRFFSSPERDAIAGIPLQTPDQDMVFGDVYLAYLRTVAETLDLRVRFYEDVVRLEKGQDGFTLTVRNIRGEYAVKTRCAVLATGNMEFPKTLGIPGEDLPNVRHYPTDPHLFFGRKLLIVGGRNSAVESAIRCYRAGSAVTISYRRSGFEKKHVYSRNRLEVNILISKGKIRFLPSTCLSAIGPGSASLYSTEKPGLIVREDFDDILLCTGYRSDFSLHRQAGVNLRENGTAPEYDPVTMETNVPGLYIAGTAAGGDKPDHGFFIGTCHDHASRILKSIAGIVDGSTGTVPSKKYAITSEDIETD